MHLRVLQVSFTQPRPSAILASTSNDSSIFHRSLIRCTCIAGSWKPTDASRQACAARALKVKQVTASLRAAGGDGPDFLQQLSLLTDRHLEEIAQRQGDSLDPATRRRVQALRRLSPDIAAAVRDQGGTMAMSQFRGGTRDAPRLEPILEVPPPGTNPSATDPTGHVPPPPVSVRPAVEEPSQVVHRAPRPVAAFRGVPKPRGKAAKGSHSREESRGQLVARTAASLRRAQSEVVEAVRPAPAGSFSPGRDRPGPDSATRGGHSAVLEDAMFELCVEYGEFKPDEVCRRL